MQFLDIGHLSSTLKDPTTILVVYSICMSFLLSTIISITYQKTFQGLSYSRNYIQSLILGCIIASIAIQAIGDNMARGLGMMGTLAIIRFRSSLKDTKDMIYMFAALSVGIASGVYSFSVAFIGTLGFCIVAFILHLLPFSRAAHFDGLLRFNLSNDGPDKMKIEDILKKNCHLFALVTLRELAQGERIDYAYQVKLRPNKQQDLFLKELQKLSSIKGISFFLQESTVEV